MKISPFKIGLILVIIGIIWTGLIFDETEKKNDSILLKQSNSFEVKSEFFDSGIGYYELYMPEFSGEEIFVQILDTKENVIEEQMVKTKMSVGYFYFNENGEHTVKITNIAKNPVDIQVEFGNTNSQKMLPSGITVVVGTLIMMGTSFLKIKNYKIEQPEENIS
jgi:hypothetical protein